MAMAMRQTAKATITRRSTENKIRKKPALPIKQLLSLEFKVHTSMRNKDHAIQHRNKALARKAQGGIERQHSQLTQEGV
jgi:hypothetical protein